MTSPSETIPNLPGTSYGILGLISMPWPEPPSGYDLNKAVEGSIGYFWTPAKSQIYGELKRLTALGYVEELEVPQQGRPDKRVYTITAAGDEALQNWLTTRDEHPEEIKSTFLLKLFFGHRLSPEEILSKMREYLNYAIASLAEYEAIEREIESHGGPVAPNLYPWMALMQGKAFARSGIEWSKEMIEHLSEGGNHERIER